MRLTMAWAIDGGVGRGRRQIMTAALLAGVTMLPQPAHAAAFTVDQLFANAIATNNNTIPGCTSEAKSSAPVTSAQHAVSLTLTASGCDDHSDRRG